MTASESQDLLPAVLTDMLSWCGSRDGEGAVLGVPWGDAWPLALRRTTLVPGDRVVMTRAGEDSARWATMAGNLGYDVVCIDVPVGEGPSLEELTHLLWWDASIKAVFVARDETSTGITANVCEVRRVMDLTGSDALLLVECSASWGTDGVRQQAWSADLVVTALGTPGQGSEAGTFLSWSGRLPGLAALQDQVSQPLHDVLVRLRGRLDDIHQGDPAGQARQWLNEGLRRGLVAAGLPGLANHDPSEAVTVVHLPTSIHATQLEQVMAANCPATTDLGVGALAGRVLRIWHTELRDAVDILTVVATVELALLVAGSPVPPGSGLEAARSWFDAPRAHAA
jgi:alanine-glyoxylate transaminase/serine-glyoxylate transaminase/serine-pyruvate transaminase